MPMQPWFPEAKLGIFVHWGIYAVKGVAESWSFFGGEISRDAYMDQLGGFTAERYDPDAWARLFAAAGAKYAVLTTKHHDGVALWDTRATDLSVVKSTPAARDLVGPFAEALRTQGLRVGLYFSHNDWNHPDYPTVRPSRLHRPWVDNRYAMPAEGDENPEAWERFLKTVHRGQIRELVENYRPDLLWFDGAWERDEQQWRMGELREEILALGPDTVLNGRMLGHGDYATPELGVPITPPEGPWELCYTIGDAWGHQPDDTRHKSVRELVRVFAETIGHGGNLLLNTGPRQDGTILPEHVRRLEGLGRWIRRHADAVYPTTAGLPYGHHYGPSTLSKDRRTVFLVCFDTPREFVELRGLHNEVRRASVLGTGQELAHRVVGGFAGHNVPGVVRVEAPATTDPYATVLALELDGELDLYRGQGSG
ncbi:alpha-L-fucosidase [Streptomyces sp. NBC_01619]|uniref:alpha-L-fucosidase n=1 Tax=Streptomyces sp. NBC_01619 TaxID=2975901 RepID=UPI00225B8277|nr:alpha-L-fucosidase [Streptomyces sp. NBC_01619]MCX4515407.1 alpha-L-fucosidase [Streptomyces sp. NBC_01619]